MERCLSSLYEAALSPDYWPDAVAEIGRAFGSGATLMHSPYFSLVNSQIWMHEAEPDSFRLAPPELLLPENNPAIQATVDEPGRMIDRQRFLPDSDVNDHPISRQFLQPNRIRHMLIGLAQFDDEIGSYFFLSRRGDQLDFDGRETALAQELSEHVGRAMRLYRSLRLAEAQTMAFGTVIEHLSQAVVLVNSELRIIHANSAAEAILAARTGVARWRHRLDFYDQHAQRILESSVQRMSQLSPANAEVRIGAIRPGGRRAFRITAYPAVGDAISALAPRGRVLVIIDDLERDLGAGSEAAAKSFGLTPAEARVAALAARPMQVAEIATQLSVSENTIKTQLKSAYQKTGATSRAELVQLLHVSAGV